MVDGDINGGDGCRVLHRLILRGSCVNRLGHMLFKDDFFLRLHSLESRRFDFSHIFSQFENIGLGRHLRFGFLQRRFPDLGQQGVDIGI